MNRHKENSIWQPVKDFMRGSSILIGSCYADYFIHLPLKILQMTSYYKFAAKMIGPGRRVLDVGCGEGLGTWLLAKDCGKAKGIDVNKEAIEVAKRNWVDKRINFQNVDFLRMKNSHYDAIVSIDVVGHAFSKNTGAFLDKISACLTAHGIVVIGMPNIIFAKSFSSVTRSGRVNQCLGERVELGMKKYFKHVFVFGANDEVVHAGFLPMANYLIAVGCLKR
ncbi:MAG: class I SAM-dependent methyltransferase [Candidatus Saganbacteria bacterium]|nr:class I SAM-dependent methyltransferase [Candidatus Saganbacteria bacterium]